MAHTLGAFTDLVRDRGAKAVLIALDETTTYNLWSELNGYYSL